MYEGEKKRTKLIQFFLLSLLYTLCMKDETATTTRRCSMFWFYGSLLCILSALIVLAVIRVGHYKAQSYNEYVDDLAERDRQLQSWSTGGFNP
jgi:hypothetical protein